MLFRSISARRPVVFGAAVGPYSLSLDELSPFDTPVREVQQLAGYNHVGHFPSRKNRRQIRYESKIERDLCFCLEAMPDVTAYRAQPLKLRFFVDQKHRCHTPDYLVIRQAKRPLLIEVKREKVANKLAFKRKMQAARVAADNLRTHFASGFDLDVTTDEDIRTRGQIAFGNAKFLYRHGRDYPYGVTNPAIDFFQRIGAGLPLFEYWHAAGQNARLIAAISAALLDGGLRYDRRVLISRQSLIYLPSSEG